jgi:hypothetical protein
LNLSRKVWPVEISANKVGGVAEWHLLQRVWRQRATIKSAAMLTLKSP